MADGSEGRGADRRASLTGLFVLLAASTMVFAAFTSAFVVRRGLSDDWASMHKPPILWVNTAVLLASSLVLDRSRARAEGGRPQRVQSLVDRRHRCWAFCFWWARRSPGGS